MQWLCTEHTSKDASSWRSDTTLRVDGGAREAACDRVRGHERAGDVRHTNGDQLLVGVDLVFVHASCRDGGKEKHAMMVL